jgi:malate/lactate dehydrogenase
MARVAVIGAAEGVGQNLSLLLKLNLTFGSTLLLYDTASIKGIAEDVSHVDTNVTVRCAQGESPAVPRDPALVELAKNVDVFVIAAGATRTRRTCCARSCSSRTRGLWRT